MLTSVSIMMMNMRKVTVILSFGILIITALLLAGCGGGSSNSSSTATTTQQQPPQHAPNHYKETPNAHYKNSCAGGVCPKVTALPGWKPGPKPAGNPEFVVNLTTFIRTISPHCAYTFQLSPPLKNPPAPSDLAKALNSGTTKSKGGKKLPPPPQYKRAAASVYVQPVVAQTVLPITPLYQSGVRYVHKGGTTYAVIGMINVGTPVGKTGSCSKSEISTAKKQITDSLVSYLRQASI